MYQVNKKNGFIKLGSSTNSIPEKAAYESLKTLLAGRGILISENDIKLKRIDENNFEFSFGDEDYVLTKIND